MAPPPARLDRLLERFASRPVALQVGQKKLTVIADRAFAFRIVKWLRPGYTQTRNQARLADFALQLSKEFGAEGVRAVWQEFSRDTVKPLTERAIHRVVAAAQEAKAIEDQNAAAELESAPPASKPEPRPVSSRENAVLQAFAAAAKPPPSIQPAPVMREPPAAPRQPLAAPRTPPAPPRALPATPRTPPDPSRALPAAPRSPDPSAYAAYTAAPRARAAPAGEPMIFTPRPRALPAGAAKIATPPPVRASHAEAPFAIHRLLPENRHNPMRVSTPSPDPLPAGEEFYQERQRLGTGGCPVHALNAFFGGPVTDLYGFQYYAAQRVIEQIGGSHENAMSLVEDSGDPQTIAEYARDTGKSGMVDARAQNTHLETFRQTAATDKNTPTEERLQAHYNSFPGDRIMLGFSRPGIGAHILTLRRNQAGEWAFIDSQVNDQPTVNLGQVLVRHQRNSPLHIIHMEPDFSFAHADNRKAL